MPDYTIELSKYAEKELDKLSDFVAAPILKAIAGLAKLHAHTVI